MARNDGIDRTSARNVNLTAAKIENAQRHNEREKESYTNPDIIPEHTPQNIHFKKPTAGYAEMFAQMEKDGTEFVWEDMRPLGEKTILEHFPHIYEQCVEEGFDPRKEPIPVVPAQHYFMGGIKVNLGSKTSMKGLYACGETSCNGVHGRNRLASNSLLESLVFARKAADDMIFGQTPEYVRADAIDMNMYESREELLNACHETVLKEIERMKKSHE